jgi:hypothetical protein
MGAHLSQSGIDTTISNYCYLSLAYFFVNTLDCSTAAHLCIHQQAEAGRKEESEASDYAPRRIFASHCMYDVGMDGLVMTKRTAFKARAFHGEAPVSNHVFGILLRETGRVVDIPFFRYSPSLRRCVFFLFCFGTPSATCMGPVSHRIRERSGTCVEEIQQRFYLAAAILFCPKILLGAPPRTARQNSSTPKKGAQAGLVAES